MFSCTYRLQGYRRFDKSVKKLWVKLRWGYHQMIYDRYNCYAIVSISYRVIYLQPHNNPHMANPDPYPPSLFQDFASMQTWYTPPVAAIRMVSR